MLGIFSKCFVSNDQSSQQFCAINIIILLLKMGKLSPTVVTLLSQGLTAIKWRLWGLNPETVLLNTMGMAIHKWEWKMTFTIENTVSINFYISYRDPYTASNKNNPVPLLRSPEAVGKLWSNGSNDAIKELASIPLLGLYSMSGALGSTLWSPESLPRFHSMVTNDCSSLKLSITHHFNRRVKAAFPPKSSSKHLLMSHRL